MPFVLAILAQCVAGGRPCDDTPGPPFVLAIVAVLAILLLLVSVMLLIARTAGFIVDRRERSGNG